MNDREDPHEHPNDTAGTGDATGALYDHPKILDDSLSMDGGADGKTTITPDGEIITGETRTAAQNMRTRKEEDDVISLFEVMEQIPNEAAAVKFFESKRWPDREACPRCGSVVVNRAHWHRSQSHWCADCRRYFSVKTGTIMAQSQLPLRKWAMAIHLIHTARKGVSSIQLSKQIGCTQKTAWFLEHRIREAMTPENGWLFTGTVEIDEAYIGGRNKNRHFNKKHADAYGSKEAVIGFRERETGRVIAFPLPDAKLETIREAVFDLVDTAAMVYTDGHAAYQELTEEGYTHESVIHSQHEYVRGDVHTNGIESFWAQLKRGYVGTFHYMSPEHLHRYANEFAYRQSAGPGNGFDTIANTFGHMVGKRLSHKDLTKGVPKRRKPGLLVDTYHRNPDAESGHFHPYLEDDPPEPPEGAGVPAPPA